MVRTGFFGRGDSVGFQTHPGPVERRFKAFEQPRYDVVRVGESARLSGG